MSEPGGQPARNEYGFLVEPLPWCPECARNGWPQMLPEKILGPDREPWVSGKIPEALRKPPLSSGPMWPSKLGASKMPGASAYCGPRNVSCEPAYWYQDVRPVSAGGKVASMLIDARGRVLLPMGGAINGWGLEGRQHFEIRNKQALLAGTPALVGNLLYAAEADGMLYCYDLEPDLPVLKWGQSFCEFVVADPSSIAASADIVVSPGLPEKPPEGAAVVFSTHLYGMDPATGRTRWSIKIPMPSLMLAPSIADGLVVCMASSGAVDCLAAKDGKPKWQVKGELGSMSTGGAVVAGETVVVASNRRGKRAWNAPFGGKGAVRAYGLKDGGLIWEQLFELEANTPPALCTAGPGGKSAVIAFLGANPGLPAECQHGKEMGDHWDGRVVALEVLAGTILWAHDMERWNASACAGHCTWMPETRSPPPGWTPPVIGADGYIYACWNVTGTLYVLNGANGDEVSKHVFGHSFASAPVLAPGMVFVNMLQGFGVFAHERAERAKLLRPLEVPFVDGSGTEHFWPSKHNDPRCLGLSQFPAPLDLSKPAWVFKTPLKVFDDWYGNSPVMDAQRNVYIGGNWSDIFVIRPDGTLRGSLHAGPYYSTPSLYEDCLYVTNCLGYALCFSLETLELQWSSKYCDWTSSDNYCVLAHEGSLFAPGMIFAPAGQEGVSRYGAGRTWFQSGHRVVYRLSCKTGEVIWKLDLNPIMPLAGGNYDVLWNFTPVIFGDFMVFMDYNHGAYCFRWSNAEYVWHKPPDGRFSTGNQCCGPNGLVYITGNLTHEIQPPRFNQVESPGSVRAYEITTGKLRFEALTKDDRGMLMSCNQGPVLIPARGGGRALVAVPFSYNMTGNPGDAGSTQGQDATAGKLAAFDAETGEDVWGTQWPGYWRHTHVGGSFYEDPGFTWPDSWGGLSVDSKGIIYAHWQSGLIYAVDGQTGEILSSYDTGNSSNAQILLAPGMAVFTGGFGVFCFRDSKLEEEWLADAKAKGDPRAKVPLGSMPTPVEDDPPRKPWEVWRGPVYAEEQNLREGSAWIEAFTKAHLKARERNEEWSEKASSEARRGASSGGKKPREWVVVGGGEKGIVVRSGKDLKSEELPRLQKGARVEQVKKEGERLHYRKLEGDGPDTGWISLSFKGSPLVQPA